MITDESLNYRFLSTTSKIIPVGQYDGKDVVAMVAGSIVINSLLRARQYEFDGEGAWQEMTFEARLMRFFLPQLVDIHESLGYSLLSTDDDGSAAAWPRLTGEILLIHDNTIYVICGYRSIMDMGSCGSVGSSQRIIYPAWYVCQRLTNDPEFRVEMTLRACLALDPHISNPFDYAEYRDGHLGPIVSKHIDGV